MLRSEGRCAQNKYTQPGFYSQDRLKPRDGSLPPQHGLKCILWQPRSGTLYPTALPEVCSHPPKTAKAVGKEFLGMLSYVSSPNTKAKQQSKRPNTRQNTPQPARTANRNDEAIASKETHRTRKDVLHRLNIPLTLFCLPYLIYLASQQFMIYFRLGKVRNRVRTSCFG